MGLGFFSGLGDVVDTRILENTKWTRANYIDNKDKATKMGAAISKNTNKELSDLTALLNKASALNIPTSALNGAYADGKFEGLKTFINTVASRDDLTPKDFKELYKAASAYSDGADVDFNAALKKALDVIPRGGSAKNNKASWMAHMIGLGRVGESPITATGPFGELSKSQTESAFSRIGSPYTGDNTLDNIKFPEVRLDPTILDAFNKRKENSAKAEQENLIGRLENVDLPANVLETLEFNKKLQQLRKLNISSGTGIEQFANVVDSINNAILNQMKLVPALANPDGSEITFTTHGRGMATAYDSFASAYNSDPRLIFDNVNYSSSFKENYQQYLDSLPRFNSMKEAKNKIRKNGNNYFIDMYPLQRTDVNNVITDNFVFIGDDLVPGSALVRGFNG